MRGPAGNAPTRPAWMLFFFGDVPLFARHAPARGSKPSRQTPNTS